MSAKPEHRRRHILSAVLFGTLVFIATGSLDEKGVEQLVKEFDSSIDESMPKAEGNRVLINASQGTTLQRNNLKKQYRGKRLEFEVDVQDVTSDRTARVMLHLGHYADVSFDPSQSAHLAQLQKEQRIRFSATIERFGTGIRSRHKLTNGVLIP